MDKAQQIIELRKSNPCLTNAAIARQVGWSREYIRQILSKSHLPTTAFYQHEFVCNYCGKTFRVKHFPQPLYCSLKCRQNDHRTKLPCFQCGKEFFITYGELRARIKRSLTDKLFCTKRCWGQYLGEHWGKTGGIARQRQRKEN